jgi:hypothetical protein
MYPQHQLIPVSKIYNSHFVHAETVEWYIVCELRMGNNPRLEYGSLCEYIPPVQTLLNTGQHQRCSKN